MGLWQISQCLSKGVEFSFMRRRESVPPIYQVPIISIYQFHISTLSKNDPHTFIIHVSTPSIMGKSMTATSAVVKEVGAEASVPPVKATTGVNAPANSPMNNGNA